MPSLSEYALGSKSKKSLAAYAGEPIQSAKSQPLDFRMAFSATPNNVPQSTAVDPRIQESVGRGRNLQDVIDFVASGPGGGPGVFSDPRAWLKSGPGPVEAAKRVGGGVTRGLTLGLLRPFAQGVVPMPGYENPGGYTPATIGNPDEPVRQRDFVGPAYTQPREETAGYKAGDVAGEFKAWSSAYGLVNDIGKAILTSAPKLAKVPGVLASLIRGATVGSGIEATRAGGQAIHGEDPSLKAAAENVALIAGLDTALGSLGPVAKKVRGLLQRRDYAAARKAFDEIAPNVDALKRKNIEQSLQILESVPDEPLALPAPGYRPDFTFRDPNMGDVARARFPRLALPEGQTPKALPEPTTKYGQGFTMQPGGTGEGGKAIEFRPQEPANVSEGQVGVVRQEPYGEKLRRTIQEQKEGGGAVGAGRDVQAHGQKEVTYKYGNTQANIPETSDAAKALESTRAQINDADLAGQGKDIGGNHVTVRYGIKGNDTEKIKAFLEQQKPFEVTLGKTAKFKPSESSDNAAVIQAPVRSGELRRINAELKQHGDFIPPTHGAYKPHATIAYVKPEVADKYTGLDVTAGKKFTVDEIVISKADGTQEVIKLRGRQPSSALDIRFKAAAEKNGVKYGGLQENPKGAPLGTFTDPQTGTTFLVDKPSGVAAKLKAKRAEFEPPKPESPKPPEPATAAPQEAAKYPWDVKRESLPNSSGVYRETVTVKTNSIDGATLDDLIPIAKREGLNPSESDALYSLAIKGELYRDANQIGKSGKTSAIDIDKVRSAYDVVQSDLNTLRAWRQILPDLKAKYEAEKNWRKTVDWTKSTMEERNRLDDFGQLRKDISWIEDGIPNEVDNYGGVNSISIRGLKGYPDLKEKYPDLAAKYKKPAPPQQGEAAGKSPWGGGTLTHLTRPGSGQKIVAEGWKFDPNLMYDAGIGESGPKGAIYLEYPGGTKWDKPGLFSGDERINVKVNLEKPFVIKNEADFHRMLSEMGYKPKVLKTTGFEGEQFDAGFGTGGNNISARHWNKLKAKGYDGVVYTPEAFKTSEKAFVDADYSGFHSSEYFGGDQVIVFDKSKAIPESVQSTNPSPRPATQAAEQATDLVNAKNKSANLRSQSVTSKTPGQSTAYSIAGAAYGIEKDKDGNWTINPTKAALGLGVGLAAARIGSSKYARELFEKVANESGVKTAELRTAVREAAPTPLDKPIESAKNVKVSVEAQTPDLSKQRFAPTAPENFKATENVDHLKDISSIAKTAGDFWRNTRDVFGKHGDEILVPLENAKKAHTDLLEKLLSDYAETVENKLKIKPNSAKDRAVQEFGEGTRDVASLKKQFGEQATADIVEAAAWYRSKYDMLLDEINTVRAIIWPNDPSKIIPRRTDYFRHFHELNNDFAALKNIFDTPAQIHPDLVGISDITKPKGRWASIFQARLGDKTKLSAAGGFANYIRQASYGIHIDPQIANLRAFEKSLLDKLAGRSLTVDEIVNWAHGDVSAEEILGRKHLNNYLQHLRWFTDDLAGKTNPAGRFIQDALGRRTFRVLDWTSNRIKKNVILYNGSSLLAQPFNIPQGIARSKQYAIPGFYDTMAGIFKKDMAASRSPFLRERYFDSAYNKFDSNWVLSKVGINVRPYVKQFGGWLMETADEVSTKFIWNSFYRKAVGRGIADPIRYADRLTREMVGGRGIGEVPIIQKSRIFQLVAPFQLEVGNACWAVRDLIKDKDLSGIATFIVASWLMNRVAERIRGNPVSFDPLQATIEGYREASDPRLDTFDKILRGGGRLGGEILSSVPLGQSLAATYPENGMYIGGRKMPTRKELFGTNDPTRFGSGVLVARGLADPLYKVFPPFGGNQIKKTVGGIEAMNQGAVYNRGGKKMYSVEQDMANQFRLLVFGKYSTPEAREYFEGKKTKTLSGSRGGRSSGR